MHNPKTKRLSLASPVAACLAAAETSNNKPLKWVRLGTFIFEQFNEAFLANTAASRWRLSGEGTAFVEHAIQRRKIRLNALDFLHLLQKEQVPYVQMNRVPHGVDLHDPNAWVVCGGVLFGVERHGWEHIWVPGALTPKQLRLFLDQAETNALAEQLSLELDVEHLPSKQRQPPKVSIAWCWARMMSLVSLICGSNSA